MLRYDWLKKRSKTTCVPLEFKIDDIYIKRPKYSAIRVPCLIKDEIFLMVLHENFVICSHYTELLALLTMPRAVLMEHETPL